MRLAASAGTAALLLAAALTACGAAGVDDVTSPSDNVVDLTGGSCQLADLFLRAPADSDGNAQPIDVQPITGREKTYAAVMDYAMNGFDLEAFAVPREQCKVSGTAQTTMLVDPGSYVMAQVQVESAEGGGAYFGAYSVNVSRLRGSETTVKALRIEHAHVQPPWKPAVRKYTVVLDVEEDIVRVNFVRLDEGQVVDLVSRPEEPMAPSSSDGWPPAPEARQPGGGGFPRIPKPPVGEVQHLPATLLTTVDVGYQRVVDVTVKSADETANGRYRFTVQRPHCPAERRFFDGDAKVCTDICNEGYFGSSTTGRCSACLQEHCAVCQDDEACSLCLDGYVLLGGSCGRPGAAGAVGGISALRKAEAAAAGYGRSLSPLLLGATGVVAVALGGCCAAVYCSRTRRKPRLLDSEYDELAYSD